MGLCSLMSCSITSFNYFSHCSCCPCCCDDDEVVEAGKERETTRNKHNLCDTTIEAGVERVTVRANSCQREKPPTLLSCDDEEAREERRSRKMQKARKDTSQDEVTDRLLSLSILTHGFLSPFFSCLYLWSCSLLSSLSLFWNLVPRKMRLSFFLHPYS